MLGSTYFAQNYASIICQDLKQTLPLSSNLAVSYAHAQNQTTDNVASQVFNAIAVTDVTSMCLVKQCKFLESLIGAEFTEYVLIQLDLSLRNLKECILKADRLKILEDSDGHPSLKYARKGKCLDEVLGHCARTWH